jgi:transaldolase
MEAIEPLGKVIDLTTNEKILQASKKKPRSEKQIEAFKKAQAKRDENRAVAKENTKKALEEKVIQKAISIKKTQVRKLQVLDQISDDETPIEEIKKIQRAMTPPPIRQTIQEQVIKKPQFYFL